MGYTKRILTVLAVLVLVASACSDDTVDQATVDSVVDDLTSDSTDPAPDPEPEADPDPAPEAEAEPEPEPEAEPEPEPEIEVTQACVVLRHYSTGLFTSPYEAFIIFDTDGPEPMEITVEHSEEYTAEVFESGGGQPAGALINWPVFAPGDVPLPTSIGIDGVELIDVLVDDHFEGMTSFVAASSEIRDEEIVPQPCGIGFMVIPEGFDG